LEAYYLRISVIGAGAQGSGIASVLANTQEVSHVVCADIDLKKAQIIVDKLKSDKLEAERVDASNINDLVRIIKGSDTVINATLPKFNLAIMNAALKSGTHYVDLAGWVPVKDSIQKQLSLDEKFKDAKLTAVIYQSGPFTLNVVIKYVVDRLDRVDEIRIRIGRTHVREESKEFIPKWSPAWSPEMALTEWAPPPVIYENGSFKEVPPLSGLEEYQFPEPVGSIPVCYVDFEPVHTLGRFIGKGVKHIDLKQSLPRMAGALVKMGFATDNPVDVKGVKVAPIDVVLALTPPATETIEKMNARGKETYGCNLAEIKGERAGKNVTHTIYRIFGFYENYERFGTRWAEVALPAVTTATMLAKGDINIRGVIPPECLDPKPFLVKLAEKGMTFQESIASKLPV
jgi:saccharopine dehydrogenase (NAD+, L-lysine-forming)